MKTIGTLAIPALLFLWIISENAAAQSPRMVLIEEATNASCGPCAAQNPFFEYYLSLAHNRSAIIPVIWHANYPGRDVMNAANPTMHNTRSTYYPITGVPTAIVNGKLPPKSGSGYDGAPSDTVALANAVRAAAGTSPITIGIAEQVNGASGSVDVTVNSTNALAGKKLRIVLVEGYHYYANAGTNGEKEFFYIARQMLPSAAGLDLTLAAGETKSFTQPFTIDASWNANEMYVVAFVQDDGTREVLQAGTDRLRMELTAGSGRAALAGSPTESRSFSADLGTPVSANYIVSVTKNLPAGWSTEVKVNGVSIADTATLALDASPALPVSVTITPADSKNRKGEVSVSIKGPWAASVNESWRLYAPDIDVLSLVKDEGNAQIATNYQLAFEQCPWKYALVPTTDENLFDWNAYGILLCEVGKSILFQSDIDKLKAYFAKGGRTYMIGAEIAWGLADPAGPASGAPNDIPFLNNFLHADYVADDNPNGTVTGIAGDPIGDGLYFSFTTGVQNQDTPDQIAPRGSARSILYYGSDKNAIAGIRYEDKTNKLVYLGFGLEGIGSLTNRAEILRRGITWLMQPAPVEGTDAPSARGIDLYPNPARDRFTLSVRLDRRARVAIRLYDLAGRLVRSLYDGEDQAGLTEHAFGASDLAAGTYLIHATLDGKLQSRLVQIVK